MHRLINDVVGRRACDQRPVWVSHLTRRRAAAAARGVPRLRPSAPAIGTDLWLGDRGALSVTATVLDVHAVERGDAFGYRRPHRPRGAGTSWSSAAAPPTASASRRRPATPSLRARAATLARGGLDAVGFVRSPFSIDGKQRLFAEPPHMQASMLFLPHGARVPAVGDEVEVRVRFTATTFDRIVVT